MATVKEVFIEARRLLAEKGHCQKAWARAGKASVNPFDPSADSYCAMGALVAACWNIAQSEEKDIVEASTKHFAYYHEARTQLQSLSYKITQNGGFFSVMEYSEAKDRTQAEVVALFDFVIADSV